MNKNRIAFILLLLILSSKTALSQELPKSNNNQNNQETTNPAVKDTIAPSNSLASFDREKTYLLGGIAVKGLKKFQEQTVKSFTGLIVGQEIQLPGDKLTSAIKKLYDTKQFSNIDVYIAKIDGSTIYLDFDVLY